MNNIHCIKSFDSSFFYPFLVTSDKILSSDHCMIDNLVVIAKTPYYVTNKGKGIEKEDHRGFILGLVFMVRVGVRWPLLIMIVFHIFINTVFSLQKLPSCCFETFVCCLHVFVPSHVVVVCLFSLAAWTSGAIQLCSGVGYQDQMPILKFLATKVTFSLSNTALK